MTDRTYYDRLRAAELAAPVTAAAIAAASVPPRSDAAAAFLVDLAERIAHYLDTGSTEPPPEQEGTPTP